MVTEFNDLIPLSDLSPRDEPWDTHRLEAAEVAFLYNLSTYPHYGERINNCANRLGFGLLLDDAGQFNLKLREARFCRCRHCPLCSWRRSLMWCARFFEALPKIRADYPKARFIFVTFTVKNCPLNELRQTVNAMNKAFVLLTKLKAWPGIGWVKSLEVTRSAVGEAHPHFHCLVMVRPSYFTTGYIKHEQWVKLWRKCLRIDYDPVVNIQAVKLARGSDPLRPSDPLEGLTEAVAETVKYSVKPSDISVDVNWLEGLTHQLHKTRAISLGGCFRNYFTEDEPENLIKSEQENDDDQSSETDPKLYFGWRERYRKYFKE